MRAKTTTTESADPQPVVLATLYGIPSATAVPIADSWHIQLADGRISRRGWASVGRAHDEYWGPDYRNIEYVDIACIGELIEEDA